MTRAISISICIMAFAYQGCFGSVPETHYYELRAPSPSSARVPGSKAVLSVEQLEVDTAYEDERIVYRTSPFKLQYYNYHQWSAPPSLHLSDYLRKAYDATGLFRQVTRSYTPNTRAVLSGRVTALEEVDVSETEWRGRIELELHLRDAESGELLWSERFREEEPLHDRSPEGLAAALSAIMARIVDATAPDIARMATTRRDDLKAER